MTSAPHRSSDPVAEQAADAGAIDPLTLDEQVCFAMVVASRALLGVYRPILVPLGLTHPQYLVMLALWQHGPVSVRTLADLLFLDPPTLSPLLKRLEQAGLLERRRHPADDRQLAVTLTDQGLALRRQALEVPGAVVDGLDLDLATLTELRTLLHRVIAGAGRRAPAAPIGGVDHV
ncbi:MAG: MarR family transcriptional regulator [Nakamurella sp.]